MKRVDIWIPALIGLGLIGFLLYVAKTAEKAPNSFSIRVYIIVLALAAAAFSMVLTGALFVKFEKLGLTIRGSAALAVFVIVLILDPARNLLAEFLTQNQIAAPVV